MTMQRLPDAEFELMKIIWHVTPPVTSTILSEHLPEGKTWKAQTILTLLRRMEQRGFVVSEKSGKERLYRPVVTEKEYLDFETRLLSKRYESSSLMNLVGSLAQSDRFGEEDLDELELWIKEKLHEK